MIRDEAVARRLLFSLEELEELTGLDEKSFESYCRGGDGFLETDLYHLNLLVRGGFIDVEGDNGTSTKTYRLTWTGHDLLNSLQASEAKK